MRFLRTNTAVIVTVGPFYDKTDGVTIETALTITNERITLTADTDAGSAPTNILDNVTGATSGTANDLNYITGNDAGMMQLELAAADVNRVGRMFLSITDAANHVPVFHEFMVMPALVYDTFFAASGGATFPAATLASTTNITAGTLTTVTTATNVTTVNGLAANVITAAATAADFTTEIQTGLATAAALDTVDNFLDTEVAAILAAVDTEVAAIITTLGTPAGVSISADIAAIEAQTDDIGAAGAGLTALATQASVDTIDNFLDTEVAAILALLDDARGEPGQGTPPVNPDLATKIDYLYKAWRNRTTQTADQYSLYGDDATTIHHKATFSDDATTADRGEIATGP